MGHLIQNMPQNQKQMNLKFLLTRTKIWDIFFQKFQGFSEAGHFDAIHVGAAAHVVPKDLLTQLKLGGRMVIPLGSESGGQWLEQIDKKMDGTIERKKLMGVCYVPLTDREKQCHWNGLNVQPKKARPCRWAWTMFLNNNMLMQITMLASKQINFCLKILKCGQDWPNM